MSNKARPQFLLINNLKLYTEASKSGSKGTFTWCDFFWVRMHFHTLHGMGCMHVNDTVHTVRLRFDEKNAITLRKIVPCERALRSEFLVATQFFQVSSNFSMIFIKFFKIPWFFQIFQVEWDLCNSLKFHFSHLELSRFLPHLSKNPFWRQMEFPALNARMEMTSLSELNFKLQYLSNNQSNIDHLCLV